MQATYPNHWTFKTKSGNKPGFNEILIADAFIGVIVETAEAGAQMKRIGSLVRQSDWGPMVRSSIATDLPASGHQVIVMHVWSESDSLDFLKARMELAVTRLTRMLETDYSVVAAPSSDEVVSEAASKIDSVQLQDERVRG